jgi:hypothetical protein
MSAPWNSQAIEIIGVFAKRDLAGAKNYSQCKFPAVATEPQAASA